MSKITIGKKVFETQEMELPQSELKFYEENPRIHSQISNFDEDIERQQEIESVLKKMEHVKTLRSTIEQNGGLVDPIIVVNRNNQYIVLDGNSRLAAYRILVEKDPVRWNTIRCFVLPKDISEDDIFTLLGQYHLIGRKDWSVFEQAAYLFRKKETSNIENDILAKSVGLTCGNVETYLRVYTFMCDHKDVRADRWSYYDEYLKNQGIKKYRETLPQIDEIFVSQVKSGEIKEARDVRDKLGVIAKASDKTAKKLMQQIINGNKSIYDAYEQFDASGKTGKAYIKIRQFREVITAEDFQNKIKNEIHSTPDIGYDLKKIKQKIDKLLKDLSL